jgi:N utilization substance protein A
VDIRSETEFAAEEAEHGYEEEEVSGRCAAILSNGRRCPNATQPGSRYCGLETHQALAGIASDRVADLSQNGDGVPAGDTAATAPEALAAEEEAPAEPPAVEPASAGEAAGVQESAGGQAP